MLFQVHDNSVEVIIESMSMEEFKKRLSGNASTSYEGEKKVNESLENMEDDPGSIKNEEENSESRPSKEKREESRENSVENPISSTKNLALTKATKERDLSWLKNWSIYRSVFEEI